MAYGVSYARSRGGLRIGRFLGGIARTALGAVTGGLASTAIGTIASAMPGGASTSGSQLAKRGGRPEPGLRGVAHRLVPGGHTGYIGGRRMNPGNAKAARRAIRRIKAVHHLLTSIMKEMPHRKCSRPHAKGRAR